MRTQPLPSTKFAIGNRVRVTWKATVYSTPSTSGPVLGNQLKGALVRVAGGPWYGNFRWWWRVDFDTGPDGWLDQGQVGNPMNQ